MELKEVIEQRDLLQAALDTAMQQQTQALSGLQETLDTCNKYLMENMAALSPGDLLALHFKTVNEADAFNARNKASTDQHKKLIEAVTIALKDYMLNNKMDQVKTAGVGMTYFTTKDSVTVKDMNAVIGFVLKSAPAPEGMSQEQWEAILGHVQNTAMWGLFKKDVTKTVVKELLADGQPMQGIEYRQFTDLAFRKD